MKNKDTKKQQRKDKMKLYKILRTRVIIIHNYLALINLPYYVEQSHLLYFQFSSARSKLLIFCILRLFIHFSVTVFSSRWFKVH